MEQLKQLYEQTFQVRPECVEPIAGAGSSRHYFRLRGVADVIGTVGTSKRENDAFRYLAGYFRGLSLPVPVVYAVSSDGMCYLQSDVGRDSLYSLLSAGDKGPESVEPLLFRVMELLPRFQYVASGSFDASYCFPRAAMDERAVMWDLNYFKYSFLKTTGVDFDEDRLEDDLLRIASVVSENPDGTLMLRDFQSRNVMIRDGRPSVIDFQGARLGDGLYDVASFVWQARAGFPDDLRRRLVDVYRRAVVGLTGCEPCNFERRLDVMVLFRTLQVLGAYGFRGYFEHKAQFMVTIPRAVATLRDVIDRLPTGLAPYLMSVLREVVALPRFAGNASSEGLTVTVMSFSYRKGIPDDFSGNGGGFVFDCRSMHNPGRYDRYKSLTGRDAPVIEFLEQQGEIEGFLDNCYRLVDPSVECYVRRGFSDLMVCFGCTGGRHRSVYGAERMARHLSQKYGVRVRLIHREQGITEVLNPLSVGML